MRALHRLISVFLLSGSVVASGQTESPYIRVVDTDRAEVRLDVAVRTLTPTDPANPVVYLVGAIHIADAPYYTSIQTFLDVNDLVLYEGVGGGHESKPEPQAGDEAASLLTARRLMFLTALSDIAVADTGTRPRDLDELTGAFGEAVGSLISDASRDGWGNTVRFEGDGFDVVSLGADGREGGSGIDADIRGRVLLENPPTLVPDPDAAGLQRDLADALGLTFQLDGVDYSRPHWRNSDLNFAEIQQAIDGPAASDAPAGSKRGEDGSRRLDGDPEPSDTAVAAEALFDTLSGDSFMAKASGFLLKVIGSSPQGRALVKVMLAETLSQAEALLSAQQGAIGDLMKVIIEDRNIAVVDDLQAVINDEPGVRSVAIFYGAGHFGDLESRINDELGYRHESTFWIPAMTIDLEDAGLKPSQVNMYRAMMRGMLESQLRAIGRD